MRAPPRVGVTLLPDPGFGAAALPLFSAGAVDAIEWDIDETWGGGDLDRPVPEWIDEVLDLYAEEGALYGHGVWYSVLSARREPRQDRWLERLTAECARRPYRHVSEHFGWTTAGRFTGNTIFPCPHSDEAVAIGIDTLSRLAAASRRPVGLENLAPSLGPADALEQGAFLEAILAPVGGFLVLDLHNIWTQAVNLDLDPRALLDSYPLHRVRELHVSGGAWVETAHRRVRTDSHDGPIPAPVIPLLREALTRCPDVEVVIYERRSETFATEEAQTEWRDDFLRVRALVDGVFTEVAA